MRPAIRCVTDQLSACSLFGKLPLSDREEGTGSRHRKQLVTAHVTQVSCTWSWGDIMEDKAITFSLYLLLF